MSNTAPEQHWSAAFNPALTQPCQSCGKDIIITMADHDRGFAVCEACTADLSGQVAQWLGMPIDAGAGEV